MVAVFAWALALWFLVGMVVFGRSVPWADLTFGSRYWSRPEPGRFSVGSLVATVLFGFCGAALWPFASRWRRLGAFDGAPVPEGAVRLADGTVLVAVTVKARSLRARLSRRRRAAARRCRRLAIRAARGEAGGHGKARRHRLDLGSAPAGTRDGARDKGRQTSR